MATDAKRYVRFGVKNIFEHVGGPFSLPLIFCSHPPPPQKKAILKKKKFGGRKKSPSKDKLGEIIP